MPPDRRLLRDIRSAYRGMQDYQLGAGQWLLWFRYNVAGSTSDPTYGTGPGRLWFPPITVPAMIGEFERAGRNYDDDGLYQVDRVHAIINYFAFFSSTLIDPDPTGQDHANDRVVLDGHLFAVSTFTPRGRVASYFLTISVDLIEVAAEELNEDPVSALFTPYLVAS